ncbi:MAG: RDD family protein [Devosia sp.]|nr:RDD family protein [Devosia sp.]
MRTDLPDPVSAPELFESVLPRRVLAFFIDSAIMIFVTAIIAIVGGIAGFFTLGLTWIALPVVIPLVILGYYAATLGSPNRATIGMAAMDLVLTPTRGAPLDGWKILVHPLVFWITVWLAWPVSLVIALLTPRREMVHDLIAGTLMLRRSPMARHWRNLAGRASTQA